MAFDLNKGNVVILTRDGLDESISVRKLPNLKNYSLLVERGNKGTVIGHFHSQEAAEEFLNVIQKLTGSSHILDGEVVE